MIKRLHHMHMRSFTVLFSLIALSFGLGCGNGALRINLSGMSQFAGKLGSCRYTNSSQNLCVQYSYSGYAVNEAKALAEAGSAGRNNCSYISLNFETLASDGVFRQADSCESSRSVATCTREILEGLITLKAVSSLESGDLAEFQQVCAASGGAFSPTWIE